MIRYNLNQNMFDNYYLLEDFSEFCKTFEIRDDSIFIGSISFENRCLKAFETLISKLDNPNKYNFEFYKVYSHDGQDQEKMDELLEANEKKLHTSIEENKLTCNIKSYHIFDDNNNLVGNDIIIESLEEIIDNFRNVFLDISSFPRSVFFPLIKDLLGRNNVKNLYILWTEKKGLRNEINVVSYSQIYKIPLFLTPIPEKDVPFFYLPVLGYDNRPIETIFKENFFDICDYKEFHPIITFPSKWPEETDSILIRHIDMFSTNITDFFKDRFEIGNVIHVPSDNPFELFLKVKEFKENKDKIYDKYIISLSPFGTKAQSLGVCLSCVLLDLKLLYLNPEFYSLSEKENINNVEDNDTVGNTCLSLIKGDIYNMNK